MNTEKAPVATGAQIERKSSCQNLAPTATDLSSWALKTADAPYAGHIFRSRLEARWAVFFDCLQLRWQYEPEAFLLPDGTPYAPTFQLHTPQGERRWVCIKPAGTPSDPRFTAFEKAINTPDGEVTGRIWPVFANGSPLEWMQAGHTFCPRCGTPCNSSHNGEIEDFSCWACDWETPPGGGHPFESNGVKGTTYTPHKGFVLLDQEQAELWRCITKDAADRAQRKRLDFAHIGGRG